MCLLSESRAWVLKSVSQTTWIEAMMVFDCASLAKNVVLAGVKSVTIYDPEPVTVQDLSTQASAFTKDLKIPKPDTLISSFSETKMLESLVQKQLCPDLLSWMLMFLYDFFRAKLARAYLSILWKDSRYLPHELEVELVLTHLLRQVVVLCGVPHRKQLEINDWTHANDIPFISADTRGLFGYA